MVQAGLGLRQLQQEEIMVAAGGRATHEATAPGITVRHLEPELICVERRRGREVGHEKHHVADFDRNGAVIGRARLVDTRALAPGVGARAIEFDRAFP